MNPIHALETELTNLQQMAQKHADAASAAARQHRAGKMTAEDLQQIVSARAAVDYALQETQRELEEARARAAEQERASEDERLLAEIAAGTVAYHQAEAEQVQLLEDLQQHIVRAMAQSKPITKASSVARSRARRAAMKLAERHGHDPKHPTDEYARAVTGADVRPLTGQETSLKWPASFRFKLLRNLPDSPLGVKVADPE
jgi:hypothetical protein